MRDIWTVRPGFYTELRYTSYEHSGLAWGTIFGKTSVSQIYFFLFMFYILIFIVVEFDAEDDDVEFLEAKVGVHEMKKKRNYHALQ